MEKGILPGSQKENIFGASLPRLLLNSAAAEAVNPHYIIYTSSLQIMHRECKELWHLYEVAFEDAWI